MSSPQPACADRSPDGRYDDIDLSNFATINVRDELVRVAGVSDVNYLGRRDDSIRAWLDPQELASRNMTAMDVAASIRAQNLDDPSGQVGQPPIARGGAFQLPVAALGRLTDPEQFGDIIVKAGPRPSPLPSQGSQAGTNGQAGQGGQTPGASANEEDTTAKVPGIVRLRDVARVELGSRQYEQSCTLNGKPSVALSIYQLPGSNALSTAGGLYAKMDELKARFPEGLDYRIVYDTTPFIRESVTEVFRTLRDAVILVGIVVLLFLQDWKAMILPMIDVPVSLIGTFAVMAALGFSLNNISLFGLVLAIGIPVRSRMTAVAGGMYVRSL
jgi:multidrug efflux pump